MGTVLRELDLVCLFCVVGLLNLVVCVCGYRWIWESFVLGCVSVACFDLILGMWEAVFGFGARHGRSCLGLGVCVCLGLVGLWMSMGVIRSVDFCGAMVCLGDFVGDRRAVECLCLVGGFGCPVGVLSNVYVYSFGKVCCGHGHVRCMLSVSGGVVGFTGMFGCLRVTSLFGYIERVLNSDCV